MPKRKEIKPQIREEPPDNSELLRAAELISKRASDMLDSNEIEAIEAVGHQAMATLLRQYSRGELPKDFAASFLRSLAEKKTSSPAQRVEQTTRLDLNVVFTQLVEVGPDTLTRMTELAKVRGEQVRVRLGVSDDYLLPSPPLDNTQANNADNTQAKPEPAEIIDIREGGTGGIRRNPLPPPEDDSNQTNLYDIIPNGVSFADKYKDKQEVEQSIHMRKKSRRLRN